ncbi:MAG: cytochrome c oxidase accessory protein CcoG [Gammaproteobacteria bacterium]
MSSNEVEVEALYAKRAKIHAREVKGFFANLRKTAVIVLLGIYYLGPWLRWGTRQAILFDLPARQFHILGLTLWPQDFVFLSWLLIMAALLLFFATTVAGRVWCGYVCPQTVWTEIFVWMERLTEGNFNQRIKLDKAPWSAEKLLRKSAKQVLWISFAAWTGFTFVGYFTPIRDLGSSLLSFNLGGWETFWICFYSLATYGNAGALREQVCIYMCPYARFQSAMFDRDTLIVSYDPARGEPRGGRRRGTSVADSKLGDCIDCQMCVQACPTGIDIRKGLQYECISCAACIDACDVVMDKVGYPRGLIRYTTQNAVQGQPQHVLRPRVILYGTILLLLFASFVITLANRAAVRLDVMRDRNTLYRELSDGQIENVYQLKILNKEDQPRRVRISVTGLPGARVETAPAEIELGPGALLDVVARISVERGAAPQGRADLNIRVEDAGNGAVQATRDARFFGPAQ